MAMANKLTMGALTRNLGLRPQPTASVCVTSATGARRHFPGNLKALKRRRETVQTVGKITNTMKVVASSKMNPMMDKANTVSPFFTEMDKAFEPLVEKVKAKDDVKILTVVVTTDKGLCGSTNNMITRMLLKQDLSDQGLIVWGDKGCGAFEASKYRANVAFSAHPDVKSPVSFIDTSAFVDKVLASGEEYDLIRIVYNRMVRPGISDIFQMYVPTLKTLLGQDGFEQVSVPFEIEAHSANELFANLHEFHLSAAMNYCNYHNQAVEMFNRRNSMDNASKNAKEIGQKLMIEYNRVRQGAITTELCEITAGAAAIQEG